MSVKTFPKTSYQAKPDRTAAERMRRYRARKQALGLKLQRKWIEATPDTYSDHSVLDARSLAMHTLIARRIRAQPELIDRARRNLARWSERAANAVAAPPRFFAEWAGILDRPLPEVLAFITSFTPTAVRLRQSSPFAGVLSAGERKRVYEAFGA